MINQNLQRDKLYIIGIKKDICTGCYACMLACSFHRSHAFSLSKSAIEVVRNNTNGNIEVRVDQSKCDLCKDEPTPLCIQYCAPHALSIIKASAR
jgi:Fe-S-cluster-containing hydrogenase component 2